MVKYVITVLGEASNKTTLRRRRDRKDQLKEKYGKVTHTTINRSRAADLIRLFGRDSVIVDVKLIDHIATDWGLDRGLVLKQFYTANGDRYAVKKSLHSRRVKHYLNHERIPTNRRVA